MAGEVEASVWPWSSNSKAFGRALDVAVHLNALLPCLVVWWSLAVMRSAWLAVFMYEAVCLVGAPWATLALRGSEARRVAASRLGPLVRSLYRPSEASSCALVTTGSLCVFGAGGFAVYLAVAQREFEDHGISEAIKARSDETGLGSGSVAKDAALCVLGIWFCTVNPVLEELYWRGYLYAEMGRLLGRRRSGSSSDDAWLPSSNSSSNWLQDENEDRRHVSRRGRRALLNAADQTEAGRWLVSVYFASFHAVVVLIFVNAPAAAATLVFLAAVSRLWIWLGEHQPFGFPFVVAFHAGADIAVVLVISACDYEWAHRAAYVAALLVSGLLGCLGAALLAVAWHDYHPLPCHRGLVQSNAGGPADRLLSQVGDPLISRGGGGAPSSQQQQLQHDLDPSLLAASEHRRGSCAVPLLAGNRPVSGAARSSSTSASNATTTSSSASNRNPLASSSASAGLALGPQRADAGPVHSPDAGRPNSASGSSGARPASGPALLA